MPFRCREKECGKRFSVKIGSVMEDSKLGYRQWIIAMYLLSTSLKSVSSMKLHRDLGITQKSAWHLSHRLRDAWNSKSGLFTGPLEVDETYFGGRRKNMSHSKRKGLKGRGAVDKAIVVGIKDRATNQITAKVIETADTMTLTPNSGPGGSSPMRPERWSCPSWPVPASGSRCSSGAVVGYRRSRCTRIAQPWPRAG